MSAYQRTHGYPQLVKTNEAELIVAQPFPKEVVTCQKALLFVGSEKIETKRDIECPRPIGCTCLSQNSLICASQTGQAHCSWLVGPGPCPRIHGSSALPSHKACGLEIHESSQVPVEPANVLSVPKNLGTKSLMLQQSCPRHSGFEEA